MRVIVWEDYPMNVKEVRLIGDFCGYVSLLGNGMGDSFPSTGENGMKWCEIRVTREWMWLFIP